MMFPKEVFIYKANLSFEKQKLNIAEINDAIISKMSLVKLDS